MGDGVNIAARLEGDRQARARSASPRTPIGRSRGGSISRSAISARPNSRTSPSRSGSIRSKSACPRTRSRRVSAAPGESARRVQTRAFLHWPRSPLALARVLAAGGVRLACGLGAAFAGRLRRRQARQRAAALDRRAAVRESERRQGAGLFRRRDHRRPDDRPVAPARQLRHRARHGLHLQGQAHRRQADRARPRRALSARRQRAASRARRSRSTRSSSRPKPARMSGPTGSTASAASLANCRSSSSPASPIRLGVELVKAEALRAMRERPNNPDARTSRCAAGPSLHSNPDKAALHDAATLFERALALDPQNVSAMIGLQSSFDLAREHELERRPSGRPRARRGNDRSRVGSSASQFYGP